MSLIQQLRVRLG